MEITPLAMFTIQALAVVFATAGGFLVIMIAAGFIAGCMVAVLFCFRLVVVMWHETRAPIPPKPCPHGHEDWDNCPDCCH